MANKKMGFEGLAYYGTAGSTATNLLTNCRDISENLEVEKGDTTVRGDSTVPPMGTEIVTKRTKSIELTMVNDETDTYLEAIRVAANLGNPFALRTKDYSSGKGFDGDVTAALSEPRPLAGEQVITITCTPHPNRVPVPYT